MNIQEIISTVSDIKMGTKRFETLKLAMEEVDRYPGLGLAVFAKEIKKNCRIYLVTTKVKT